MSVTNKKDNLEHLTTLNIDELKKLVESKEEISYAKFCPLINLPPLTGASKRSQLKALNEVCEYEKNGTKFKFLRIRDDDEIVVGRENVKYAKLIEDILSNYLLEQKEDIVFFTPLELIRFLGIINVNYTFIKGKHEKWYKKNAVGKFHKNDFSIREMNFFLKTAYTAILKPIIRSAIKAMDGKRLVRVQAAYSAYIVRENGNRQYVNILQTQADGKKMSAITAQVLREFKYESIQYVYFKGKKEVDDFYKRCNELCKEKTQYDGYYDCYAIILNKEGLGYHQKKNIDALRYELNKRIVDTFIKNQKMREKLPAQKHENLIDAFIRIDTKYDLQQDYLIYKSDVLNKENNIARI